MELKVGDFILIDKDTAVPEGYATTAKNIGAPVKVYVITTNSICCATMDLVFNSFQANAFAINLNSKFKILNKDEIEKITKSLNKAAAKENKIKIKNLLNTKRIPISERKDYFITNKLVLHSVSSFAKIFTIDTNKENIKNYSAISNQWCSQCCAFSKITNNIVCYIPKSWLNYFGYNLTDLKLWINFLTKCDINFKADILEPIGLYEAFKSNKVLKWSFLSKPTKNFYINDNEIAYPVLIYGSKNNKMLTYMYFILIRYIFNSQYWNIPSLAMKLKKKMSKASHWDCLLLAHNVEIYNNYYALFSITNYNSVVLPTKKCNTQKLVNNGLQNGASINSCFESLYKKSHKTIRDLIIDENYDELQKILDEYKNNY